MRIQLSNEDRTDNQKIRKGVLFSVITNILEIVASIVMVFLVMQMIGGGVEETLARMTAVICMGIVTYGAMNDIGKTIDSLSILQREQALEQAYHQLENLNREMRSQRHDFMNHIQVIYSLIEMEEPDETLRYIDRIYGDMQRVSKMLRTDCPAINALIQAKSETAKRKGVDFALSIGARWDDPMIPSWELSRILGNLIDNAMDAVVAAQVSGQIPKGENPRVELVLGEDKSSWFFSVCNNGPEIPEKVQKHILEPGYTTKATGTGMGLYIVNRMIEEMGGELTMSSSDGSTVFAAFIPRSRLQLPEGRAEGEPEG